MTARQTYARGTKTTAASSQAEVVKTLTRYGATSHGVQTDQEKIVVAFVIGAAAVRMTFAVPHDKNAKVAEQLLRERWRLVCMVLKTKLELTRTGARTVQQEFLDSLVVGEDRQTIGEQMRDKYAELRIPLQAQVKVDVLALPQKAGR